MVGPPVSAREEMLRRVRQALSDVPAQEAPADVGVPRGYARSGGQPGRDRVDVFAARVSDYDARVTRAPRGRARWAVQEICAGLGVERLLIPADLPLDWQPNDLTLVSDTGLGVAELNGVDAVLTGCASAIALTGTLILDSGPGQGRRVLSLLPDRHICVVLAEDIVDTVPEGLEAVAGAAREGRPLTLISGPSATSDIELRRVDGVHGPRQLEVLILEQAAPAR